jgi:hypothetical protein
MSSTEADLMQAMQKEQDWKNIRIDVVKPLMTATFSYG